MPVSRRTFLAGVAAVPFAAGLDARGLFGATSKPRVVVVGAGAFGGWTALQLLERGAHVTMVDEWGPGNSLSSSGGKTRVIRAIYGRDRIYTEMVKRAYPMWERLAATSHEPLYVPMGALWMERSDDSYVRAAIPILQELGFPVDKLTVDEAAKRYPQIDFNGVKTVYFEQKAGALYARHACVVVRDQFDKKGGVYETATTKPGPVANGSMNHVTLSDGKKLEADAFVFACGPWLGKLFPDVIGDRVLPTRQEVYYFATPPGKAAEWSAKHLPIWIDFGPHIVYGIPDVEGKWLKVADDTRGQMVDPTTQDRHPRKDLIERARHFLGERFPAIAKEKLLDAEVCQYENSPDGNLIVDRHPDAKNVWLLGGGSGHGFKLAPAVGELAAEAILAGKAVPETFKLERLRGGKRKTQFDTTTTG